MPFVKKAGILTKILYFKKNIFIYGSRKPRK